MASNPEQTTTDDARSMALADILLLLSRTRLFAGLSSQQVGQFAKSLEGIGFEPGDELLTKGDESFGVSIVLRGSLEVLLPGSAATSEVSLGTLRNGDFFGEYSVFDDQPASATVRALRPGELIRFPKDLFRKTMNQDAAIARQVYLNLLGVLVERLRGTGQDFAVLLGGKSETD